MVVGAGAAAVGEGAAALGGGAAAFTGTGTTGVGVEAGEELEAGVGVELWTDAEEEVPSSQSSGSPDAVGVAALAEAEELAGMQ